MPTNLDIYDYIKYFIVSFEENRYSVNPYAVIAEVAKMTGLKPLSVTGQNRTSFVVELRNRMQAGRVVKMTHVQSKECNVTPHPSSNQSRGLIYIHEFDVSDFDDFQGGLKERYNISDIQEVAFIKTRNPDTKAFIATFLQETLSQSLYIPGDRLDTRVIPFINRPMMCHKCQGYGHTAKRCTAENTICKRCSVVGHSKEHCCADQPVCHHCKQQTRRATVPVRANKSKNSSYRYNSSKRFTFCERAKSSETAPLIHHVPISLPLAISVLHYPIKISGSFHRSCLSDVLSFILGKHPGPLGLEVGRLS